MAITKYASLENVQILELRSTPVRARHASLGKLADFHAYRTDDGFLYARIRAISSRVNKNHDGWPAIELAGDSSILDRHLASTDGFTVTADRSHEYGFSTFLGKPIFVDHHNSDPDRARGVIVDASLHVDDHRTSSTDPYYSSAEVDPEHLPGTWVELLLEVDAKAFPRFAKAIVAGSRNPRKGIDGWSMGCDVEKSVCSICKNAASAPDDYCDHIKMKGAYFDFTDPKSGRKTSRKAYENCYGIKFFEISGVFDPADETALSREIRSKTQEETITQDPKEKGLKDVADEQATDLLEESGEKAQKRKKKEGGSFPFDDIPGPGQAMVCPNCNTEGCPMCNGKGYFKPPHPGSDTGMVEMPTDRMVHQEWGNEVGGPNFDYEYGPVRHGKVAGDNPLPQSEMSHAPEKVDTLREEEICPVCGSSMDEDTCDVCSYQRPPEGFGNPDLTKAQDVDLPTEPMDDHRLDAPGVDPTETQGPGQGQGPPPTPQAAGAPSNPSMLAHVTNDMAWDVHKTSARINQTEQAHVSTDKPQTNEPKEKILSDQTKPVTSRVRTAEDFIAAAGATRRNTQMNHTADAASGAPAVAKPDVKTEVTGVGGVDEASNEAASKADSQVEVTAIGGTGVESVGAEKEGVKVDQGDEHSKNIDAIHTDTWQNGEGDSLGQHDPVTTEVPSWVEESHWSKVTDSGWHVEGHDDAPFPNDEIGGGSAVQGVKPIAETFGERVDVLDHVTSPSNNSGPTTTWTGTDGNGVLKQQDPVTTDSIARGESGMEGAPNWTSSTHIFAAFKLADLEVDLGLIPADQKYPRAAELERETPEVVEASLKYAQRVRKASRRTAGVQKLPVMGRSTEVKKEAAAEPNSTEDDSFMFGGL